MAGIGPNGLEIRTQPELQELLEQAVDGIEPGVNLRAGPVQAMIGVNSEQLALCWEALQALYASRSDSGSSGVLLDALAALTGTERREPTRSRVVATVNLAAGATLPEGAVAAVAGSPDSQFRTVEAVTNPAGIAANVDVQMESVATGPIASPAAALTVIVTAHAGWNTVTNADPADLGAEVAEDPELRTQRVIELAGAGQDSYSAIRSAVMKVIAAVVEGGEAQVYGNETLVTDADGRPGKSFEVVVWDGSVPPPIDDDIAQAIWESKPAGILAHGNGEIGTAIDEDADVHLIEFTRATPLRVYVTLQVVLAPGTGAGWEDQIADALAARGDEYTVGETGYVSQLIAALIDEVGAVVAVTTITMEAGDATPDDALVNPAYDEIIRIAVADVTVTEAP